MIEPGRYPIEPLADALGITLGRIGRPTDGTQDTLQTLADLIGVSLRTVKNYRTHGLTSRQADRTAIHLLHKHPAQLWPAWFRQANVDADLGDLEPVDMRDDEKQPTRASYVQRDGCTSDIRSGGVRTPAL